MTRFGTQAVTAPGRPGGCGPSQASRAAGEAGKSINTPHLLYFEEGNTPRSGKLERGVINLNLQERNRIHFHPPALQQLGVQQGGRVRAAHHELPAIPATYF